MLNKKILVFYTMLGLMFISPAFAATPEQIQRQQQQQIEADQRARDMQAIQAQSPYVDGKLIVPDRADADKLMPGRCVDIKTVKFGGNTILSDRAIRKTTSKYENKCLTIDQINQMLNDITNAYYRARLCNVPCVYGNAPDTIKIWYFGYSNN